MGEHFTLFDYLPGIANLEAYAQGHLGRTFWLDKLPTSFSLVHVLLIIPVLLFTIIGGLAFSRSVSSGGEAAIVPPGHFNLRNLFEMFTDAVYGLAEGVMGEHNAQRFLPFIGTLACFIFFSNCLALIPGFSPPTAVMKTNLAIAGAVFVMTHYWGVKAHGLPYLKHFLGPVWWLAPLMLVIELISHVARPVSLTLRLLGNMLADHAVVFAFFSMVPFLIPVPFLLLGVMVCIVQTLVFCLLTMVYIQGAVAHEEH